MIFTYFYKRAYILLALSLSLIQAADYSQQQFALAFLYNQQLSTKQKQLIGSAAVVSLGLIVAILYLKRTKSSTNPPKDPNKSKVNDTADETKHDDEALLRKKNQGKDTPGVIVISAKNNTHDPLEQNNRKTILSGAASMQQAENESNKSKRDTLLSNETKITDDNTTKKEVDSDGEQQSDYDFLLKELLKNAEDHFGDYYKNVAETQSHKKDFYGDEYTKKIKRPKEVIESAKTIKLLLPKKCHILIENFINYKKKYGTEQETIYYKDMQLNQFIDKMWRCRPIMFCGTLDTCILHNNAAGYPLSDFFQTGVKENINFLNNYMSYDEIMIASFLGVTAYAYPFNNGARNNVGYEEKGFRNDFYNKLGDGTYTDKKVHVTGLVGPRFEKPSNKTQPGEMDWKTIIIDDEQNTVENGYGEKLEVVNEDAQYLAKRNLLEIWAEFYEVTGFPTYDSLKELITAKQEDTFYMLGDIETRTEQTIYLEKNSENESIFSKRDIIPMFNNENTKYLFFNIAIYKKRVQYMLENYYRANLSNESISEKRKKFFLIW